MKDIIIDSYLGGSFQEENILHEAISIKDMSDKIKSFRNMFDVILKMKNKKSAYKFLRKNSSKFQKILKYIVKNFDPFEEIPMGKTEEKQIPTQTDKSQTEKTTTKRKTKEKVTESSFEIGREKIIKMLKKLFDMIKNKIKNIDIDYQTVVKAFNVIYFTIIKSIELTALGVLYYVVGPYAIGIMSAIILFVVLTNMMHIKIKTEDMTMKEAFLKSVKEILLTMKNLFLKVKVEKEETIFSILWVLFYIFISYVSIYFTSASLLTLLASGGLVIYGTAAVTVIFSALSLYLLLKMLDRVSSQQRTE